MADQEQAPGLLANILAVAGFFILIVIIVWGAYHLLRLTGSGLTSLFSRFSGAGSSIELTLPTSPVQAGKPFSFTWDYSAKEAGSYAFLYQCKSGFRFDVTTDTGSVSAVPCGNAFSVGTNKTLSLTPSLSGASSLEIPVSVVFIPTATTTSERPQGTGTITIISGTGSTTPPTNRPATTTTTTKPTTTPRPTTPAAAGIADLSVRIIATGVIDPAGNFIARAPMSPEEIAAVKFDIGNVGTKSTGTWYFTAQLPMQGGYMYTSPAQMNLAPGGHIENILRFKPAQSGGGAVSVSIDTTNAVRESNESNNTASHFMPAGTWTGGYYQPYVY